MHLTSHMISSNCEMRRSANYLARGDFAQMMLLTHECTVNLLCCGKVRLVVATIRPRTLISFCQLRNRAESVSEAILGEMVDDEQGDHRIGFPYPLKAKGAALGMGIDMPTPLELFRISGQLRE